MSLYLAVAPVALPCRAAISPNFNAHPYTTVTPPLVASQTNQQQFPENSPSTLANSICYSPSPSNPTDPLLSTENPIRQTQKTKDENEPIKKFFCTFFDCEQQFSKSEWKKHEELKHEHNVEYKCKSEDCQSQFKCPKKFNRHLQKSSECRKKSDCAAKCRNFVGLKKAWGCGFCAGTFYEWNERVAHVEKHQEQGMQKMAWSHSRVILGLLNQRAMRDHWPYLKKETFDHNYPGYLWDPIATRKLQEDLEYGGQGDKARLVSEARTLLTKDSLNLARDLDPLSTPLSLSTSTATVTDPRQHNITENSGLPISSVATSSTNILEASTLPVTDNAHKPYFQADSTPTISYSDDLMRRVTTTPKPIANNDDAFNLPRAETFPRIRDRNIPSSYAATVPFTSTYHNPFPWSLSEAPTYRPRFDDSQTTPFEYRYDSNNTDRHTSSIHY